MNKLLAILFVLTCIVALQVLIMMHGWGLEPRSWWWIVGGGVVGQTFLKALGDKALKSE